MGERLDAAHDECVDVADNPAEDFVAPNALDWLTVRIACADNIYEDATTAGGVATRHVITSLDEIDDLIHSTDEK